MFTRVLAVVLTHCCREGELSGAVLVSFSYRSSLRLSGPLGIFQSLEDERVRNES